MNFITNTNAPDRKKLVKALAEHFDFDAAYAGPPTFDYKVGEITINRNGQLATENEALAARLKDFLIQNEWLDAEATEAEAPAEENAAEPAPEEAEPEQDLGDTVMKVGFPLEGMTATAMTNLIHLLYSKQYLLAKSVREECIAITDEAISELHEQNPLTVEDAIALIRDLTKRGCIKGMAISETDILLAFPLTEDDATRAAFQHLGVSIINFAKAATRVAADFQKPEAEKYHMRGWLLRLGFGGPANAGARKILLQHLAGCSAFPNAEQAKRHADKYAAIRKEQREAARAAAEAPDAAPAPAPIQETEVAEETPPADAPVAPDTPAEPEATEAPVEAEAQEPEAEEAEVE